MTPSMNMDDFLTISEEVWPIQKNHLFMARKSGCPSAADLTHFGVLVEREALKRASLAQPASVPAGRSQLTAVDAAKLSGLMHDAAIRYADGYTVDFDAEASEFLVGAAPQPAQADQSPAEGDAVRAERDQLLEQLAAAQREVIELRTDLKCAHARIAAERGGASDVQPKGMGDLNLSDPAVQKRLAAQWGYVQAPAPVAEKAAWVPYLSDRADGVEGHYAIARWNPAGYREVWNLRSHRWASASDDVLCLEEADSLLSQIVIPTVKSAAQATAVQDGKEQP